MRTVNIHEAKTHLSRLVEEVAAGQGVIIAKAGKPMARLVPLEVAPSKRRLGLFKG
jgi:prevent-host-death family protein